MTRKKIRFLTKDKTFPGIRCEKYIPAHRYAHTVTMKYCSYQRWTICTVLLALCSCTSLTQTTWPAHSNSSSASEAEISKPKKMQHIQPVSIRNANKLTAYAYSYRADIQICYPSKLEFELNAWLLNCDDQDEEGRSEILKAELFKSKGLSWPQVETSRFQFKFNDRWQLIADTSSQNSVSENEWHGIRMPIPRLTYESGSLNISTIYMPSIQGYNLNATMGIYLTITL